jgi:ferrous iron transport protein A
MSENQTYLSLPELKIGSKAMVVKIHTEDEGMLRHLMAMGIIQGVTVVVERRFPSYVVKVGRSRAALDIETARTIYVTQEL